MYITRVFYLTILLLYSSCHHFAQCSVDDEFVDPLDMVNYDPLSKSMRKSTKSVVDHIQNDRCTVFLSRFINILLKNTGLSNSDHKPINNEKLKSYASITLTVQDLQLLKNMASKKEIDYTEIDRILNDMFIPLKNVPGFEEVSYRSVANMFFEIKDVLYWIPVGSISIILLYIIFHNFRYVFSVTFILFVIFALAFASTWYTMYMKAEINRSVHMDHMPSHCFKKTGGWLSWFRTNDLDECKKYREAIYLDPKFSIALTEVFAEMFSKIMMKPVESLGNSIYIFNKAVLQDFPRWAQVIMVPIIIIIVIKTMLLACALLVGRHLSMKSIFGYGSTSIGPGPSNTEKLNSNISSPNVSTHPTTSAQCIYPQTPDKTNVNFNINLFHPSSNNFSSNLMRVKELKINHKNESNLISMLKNKEIDSVDSSKSNKCLKANKSRHRTLSI